MALVPVDIFVSTDEALPVPISGASVGVYDANTWSLIELVVTDVNGRAGFQLDGSLSGTQYEVRITKLGAIFGAPKAIVVLDPAVPTNKFDVSGTPSTLPIATDPRLCRCTARLVDFSNRPSVNALVRISSLPEPGTQVPKLVDGNLVNTDSIELHTDKSGKISVDLMRGGEYLLVYSGEDDATWEFVVPDRASANLIDLVFIYPVSATWDALVAPSNSVTVQVGQQLVVPFSLLFSDFQISTDQVQTWLTLMNSSELVLDLKLLSGNPTAAVLTGLTPGTANVTMTTNPVLPKRVPAPAIQAPTLTVTVTP
jgi:hypothetical protein